MHGTCRRESSGVPDRWFGSRSAQALRSRVHPTYVQNMLSDPRYSAEDILVAIEELGRSGGASYSMDRAVEASAASAPAAPGSWDASGWCEGRPDHFELLFESFKEKFYLPSIFVDLGNCLC